VGRVNPVISMPIDPHSSQQARPAAPFRVGQDGDGRWIAVETGGRAGGLFRTQRDAIRYACAVTGCRPDEVALAVEPLNFRVS